MWINLSSRSGGYSAIDTITEVSKGRIMTCISDYYPENGLNYTAEDISSYLEKGYVGYKIWSGRNHLDNPAHEAVYTAMEKAGMVMASVHIAGPNAPFG